jgi:hypothetical protein
VDRQGVEIITHNEVDDLYSSQNVNKMRECDRREKQ